MSLIVNASGSLALPRMAVRSELIEYQAARERRLLQGNSVCNSVPSAATSASDDSRQAAPVVNYRVSPGGWFSLGSLITFQEPKHDSKTDSGSRATAASARNRLVLGGPPLCA